MADVELPNPEELKEVKEKAFTRRVAADEECYRTEKQEIEQQAKDPYFDYAEVLLQIAIVMATIAIIAGSRAIFGFAVGAAALGALLSLNGFLLLVRLPFFH